MDYFYFTKGQRRAVVVLILLAITVVLLKWVF